jgi:putative CocE/NonD family hydrolase
VEHRRAWITTADGTRLAARLWIPDSRPAAVLLEALPYRMDDLTASYSSEYERLCREGGFAVCRLDVRGTGSSEGVAADEYTREEHADICEVIAWLAAEEWSNGRVGMYGTSWSGFNSIQVACERPPALGAIAPIYATDDRYTDDVHYMGGAEGGGSRRLGALHGCVQRASSRARGVRGGLARRVAAPDRRHRALASPLARGAGRRSVLAARIAAPGLRADRVSDADRRGLGRRVPQQHVSHLRGAPVP